MQLATGAPDHRLRPLLRPYAGYVERTAGRLLRAELPHPNVVLILSFGPAIDFPERGGERPGSFAAGLHLEPVLTGHDGFQQGVQVYLSPPLASMVFSVPAGELAGEV